jgi:hypothetical protein
MAEPLDESQRLYEAEVRIAGSMAEIERERIETEASIAETTELLRQAEATANSHAAKLLSLKDRQKTATERILLLARKLVEITQEKRLPSESEILELESNRAEGWRLASTVEVLGRAAIKGLSKKKIEMLAEHAGTLGELDSLRALAVSDGVAFHEKLPKGIGDAVSQLIRDCLVDYAEQWVAHQSDPARAKMAEGLLLECREAISEWQASDCVPTAADDEHLHAGYTAFADGVKPTGFLSDDRKKAKSWMMGWAMAERAKAMR